MKDAKDVFEALAEYITEVDISQSNVPVGITISSMGNFYVHRSTTGVSRHLTFEAAVNVIAEFLNDANKNDPTWIPLKEAK